MNFRVFIPFLLILLSLMVALSAFVAVFLGGVLDLSRQTTVIVGGGIMLLVLSYIPSEFYSRRTDRFWIRRIASTILGVFSVLISATAVGYLALAIGLDSAWLAAVVLGSTVFLAFWAILNNHRRPVVTSLGLHFSYSFLPIRIVQLTDIHLNGLRSTQWVQGVVDTVNGLKPDVVVFTGDLIDVKQSAIEPHLAILKTLTAPVKLAVSGNHDFYTGYDEFQRILKAMDFELIDNRMVRVGDIQIIGVPDAESKRFAHLRSRVATLMADRNPNLLTIVLDHRPDHFRKNVKLGADLQFSGHTHWGQLPPFGILVRLRYRYAAGLKRFRNAWIYTSRGTGTWGPPMRLFTRSEIVAADLRPESCRVL